MSYDDVEGVAAPVNAWESETSVKASMIMR
jgi:hypothetical protein